MLYLYLLAAWIGNELIAALAVIFFSMDPTLLGHSTWVCTDVAACAGFLAAMYHGLRWAELRGWRHALAAGIAIGAAIAAKFSCIFVVPAIGLLMIVRPLSVFTSALPNKLRTYFRRWPSIAQMVMVGVIAFLTLWATYFFDVDRLSNQTIFGTQRAEWQRIPARLREARIPMPSLVLGMMRLVWHNNSGDNNYLNGQFKGGGWWYYFPEAIAIKEPLALLGGLVISISLFFVPGKRAPWQTAVILLPPAIFLAAAMKGSIEIGIRHVLPVLPFLYLLVCFQLTRAGKRGLAVLSVLIFMAMIESIMAAPDYIGFFNLAVGGSNYGTRYLSDSNIDWGQDVARLADWLHSDDARSREYSLKLFMLPGEDLRRQFGLKPATPFSNTRRGLLAISKNVSCGGLAEDFDKRLPRPDYRWLSQYPVVKRIGCSIDVYDLDIRPSATQTSSTTPR